MCCARISRLPLNEGAVNQGEIGGVGKRVLAPSQRECQLAVTARELVVLVVAAQDHGQVGRANRRVRAEPKASRQDDQLMRQPVQKALVGEEGRREQPDHDLLRGCHMRVGEIGEMCEVLHAPAGHGVLCLGAHHRQWEHGLGRGQGVRS